MGDNAVSFEIHAFGDETFTNKLSNTTVFEAGQTAFLEVNVVGNFDSDLMEWSVLNCKVNESSSANEYELFNASNGVCLNNDISLNFTEVEDNKRIQYMVFLFSGLDMGDYQIHCDIEVCMKSVEGTVCDTVSENCDFQDWDDPLDPFEDLDCQPGEDVTDRPEIYADFEAAVCGPF